MKLWAGRFTSETNQHVDEYNASILFDQQLAAFDIAGSLAHVNMLGFCGIIPQDNVALISTGLNEILQRIKNNTMSFNLDDEDIHMNIERALHHLIGDVAGQLHTGRSRNDQVALDMHLYLRHHLITVVKQLSELMQVILTIAEAHIDTIMPGYTHLQRAEPIRFAHHMMAYFHMFSRDVQRLMDSFSRINTCPLGAGALAGSGLAIDRQYVADLLNFDSIYMNSLDAVSDRDFVVEFLSNASLIMMHFSKLSEEIILWSSQEFGFIQLDDAFCTGSSMMPQKKNPDVAELARAKTGRVYGALIGLLTVLKGLPLAYNKDLQEDKEGLFDTVKTLRKTLAVYTPMLASMTINKITMKTAASNDLSNATQLANYLVKLGTPFRQAHEITGTIVLYCLEKNKLLSELSLAEYQHFFPSISDDVYQRIDLVTVVESHRATGGTAKHAVMQTIEQGKTTLVTISQWLESKVPGSSRGTSSF